METEQQPSKNDPFNWPPMNRCDLMSRQNLNAEKDKIQMKTPVMMKF